MWPDLTAGEWMVVSWYFAAITGARADLASVLLESIRPLADPPASTILKEYFGTSAEALPIEVVGELSTSPGYFTFAGIVCYGRCSGVVPSLHADRGIPEVGPPVLLDNGSIGLPFDFTEVVANLREERYEQQSPNQIEHVTAASICRRGYYLLRPLLPVRIRRHLQKLRLAGWSGIRFPRWPIDTSVDDLFREVLRSCVVHGRASSVPFIWFWPDGAPSAAMMTHDVEGPSGGEFCSTLMDIDASFGIRSSFQVIPDAARACSSDVLVEMKSRGFEVNVHDLTHDGSLFADRDGFLEKAALINSYGGVLRARGFRSGAMYRKQAWFGALRFSYDMSVPNAAHLEPQRGGCCTVFPYFVRDILELPLTTTQDYSLFHILGKYSTGLWKEQIAAIAARHGLISFITHPDYLLDPRALEVYEGLLAHLSELRAAGQVWIAAPGDIDAWWRSRAEMRLVNLAGEWRIAGDTSGRARVAYAEIRDGQVVYRIDPATEPVC